MIYRRNGKVSEPETSPAQAPIQADGEAPKKGGPAPIRVNGFKQVLELLQVADPEFRASLLRRICEADPPLGAALRKELGQ